MATEKKTTKPKPSLSLVESKKAAAVPLIVEPHPNEYTGFPFVTLVQYRKQPILTIIDNADESVVRAFVLDLCGPESVDEDMLIMIASEWYDNNRTNFPISVEFSRRGLTPMTSKIYRALSVEFVSRIIGPVARYPMTTVKSVKRRRRKALPANVEVRNAAGNNVLTLDQLFE